MPPAYGGAYGGAGAGYGGRPDSSGKGRDRDRDRDLGPSFGRGGKGRPQWDPRSNARNPDLENEKRGDGGRGRWYSDHDDRRDAMDDKPDDREGEDRGDRGDRGKKRSDSPKWGHDMF